MSVPTWMRLAGKSVGANTPTILSGLAVAGVVATTALAIRATPGAMTKLADAKHQKALHNPANSETPANEVDGSKENLSIIEVVKATWRDYLPAAASCAATVACVIGANQIGVRRSAALMGAYTLADTAFREYKDEVIAQIGKTKEQKVNDAIQARHIDENPVTDAQVIITGGGDQLCYDSLTGRYFKSDVEAIRRAENEIKRRVLTDMYASHNEFYEILGLESVTIGEELGWNIEHIIELVFTSHLATDGRPCLAVGYSHLPRVDYGKF